MDVFGAPSTRSAEQVQEGYIHVKYSRTLPFVREFVRIRVPDDFSFPEISRGKYHEQKLQSFTLLRPVRWDRFQTTKHSSVLALVMRSFSGDPFDERIEDDDERVVTQTWMLGFDNHQDYMAWLSTVKSANKHIYLVEQRRKDKDVVSNEEKTEPSERPRSSRHHRKHKHKRSKKKKKKSSSRSNEHENTQDPQESHHKHNSNNNNNNNNNTNRQRSPTPPPLSSAELPTVTPPPRRRSLVIRADSDGAKPVRTSTSEQPDLPLVRSVTNPGLKMQFTATKGRGSLFGVSVRPTSAAHQPPDETPRTKEISSASPSKSRSRSINIGASPVARLAYEEAINRRLGIASPSPHPPVVDAALFHDVNASLLADAPDNTELLVSRFDGPQDTLDHSNNKTKARDRLGSIVQQRSEEMGRQQQRKRIAEYNARVLRMNERDRKRNHVFHRIFCRHRTPNVMHELPEDVAIAPVQRSTSVRHLQELTAKFVTMGSRRHLTRQDATIGLQADDRSSGSDSDSDSDSKADSGARPTRHRRVATLGTLPIDSGDHKIRSTDLHKPNPPPVVVDLSVISPDTAVNPFAALDRVLLPAEISQDSATGLPDWHSIAPAEGDTTTGFHVPQLLMEDSQLSHGHPHTAYENLVEGCVGKCVGFLRAYARKRAARKAEEQAGADVTTENGFEEEKSGDAKTAAADAADEMIGTPSHPWTASYSVIFLHRYPGKQTMQRYFRSFFSKRISLPINTFISHDYACSIRKNAFSYPRGRLYVTDQYVCFYSHFLNRTTMLAVPVSFILDVKATDTGMFGSRGLSLVVGEVLCVQSVLEQPVMDDNNPPPLPVVTGLPQQTSKPTSDASSEDKESTTTTEHNPSDPPSNEPQAATDSGETQAPASSEETPTSTPAEQASEDKVEKDAVRLTINGYHVFAYLHKTVIFSSFSSKTDWNNVYALLKSLVYTRNMAKHKLYRSYLDLQRSAARKHRLRPKRADTPDTQVDHDDDVSEDESLAVFSSGGQSEQDAPDLPPLWRQVRRLPKSLGYVSDPQFKGLPRAIMEDMSAIDLQEPAEYTIKAKGLNVRSFTRMCFFTHDHPACLHTYWAKRTEIHSVKCTGWRPFSPLKTPDGALVSIRYVTYVLPLHETMGPSQTRVHRTQKLWIYPGKGGPGGQSNASEAKLEGDVMNVAALVPGKVVLEEFSHTPDTPFSENFYFYMRTTITDLKRSSRPFALPGGVKLKAEYGLHLLKTPFTLRMILGIVKKKTYPGALEQWQKWLDDVQAYATTAKDACYFNSYHPLQLPGDTSTSWDGTPIRFGKFDNADIEEDEEESSGPVWMQSLLQAEQPFFVEDAHAHASGLWDWYVGRDAALNNFDKGARWVHDAVAAKNTAQLSKAQRVVRAAHAPVAAAVRFAGGVASSLYDGLTGGVSASFSAVKTVGGAVMANRRVIVIVFYLLMLTVFLTSVQPLVPGPTEDTSDAETTSQDHQSVMDMVWYGLLVMYWFHFFLFRVVTLFTASVCLFVWNFAVVMSYQAIPLFTTIDLHSILPTDPRGEWWLVDYCAICSSQLLWLSWQASYTVLIVLHKVWAMVQFVFWMALVLLIGKLLLLARRMTRDMGVLHAEMQYLREKTRHDIEAVRESSAALIHNEHFHDGEEDGIKEDV